MQGLDISGVPGAVNDFVAAALVVPVTMAGMSSSSRLHVHKDYPQKFDLLRKTAETCLRRSGHVSRTADMIDGILNNKLTHDLWYLALKNGPTIILVNSDVYQELEEREIVEQVHKSEVDSAAQRGESISEDVLSYYRNKARPKFSHVNS